MRWELRRAFVGVVLLRARHELRQALEATRRWQREELHERNA